MRRQRVLVRVDRRGRLAGGVAMGLLVPCPTRGRCGSRVRSAARPARLPASALAVAGAVHAAWNLHRLRRPPADPPPVPSRSRVLLPVRDEADAGRAVPAVAARPDGRARPADPGARRRVHRRHRRRRTAVAAGDPRLHGAARRAAARADGGASRTPASSSPTHVDADVLVFVDADVVLAPHAVAATVALLRWSGLDLVSPYPRQVAVVRGRAPGAAAAAVVVAHDAAVAGWRSGRRGRALAAANGQLLAVDALAYRRAGGHAAVRAEMLEDVALLRAVKRAGGRGGVVDGTRLATCRMYDGWPAMREGYAKSLWSAFGSPAGAVAVVRTARAGLRRAAARRAARVTGRAGRATPPASPVAWSSAAGCGPGCCRTRSPTRCPSPRSAGSLPPPSPAGVPDGSSCEAARCRD